MTCKSRDTPVFKSCGVEYWPVESHVGFVLVAEAMRTGGDTAKVVETPVGTTVRPVPFYKGRAVGAVKNYMSSLGRKPDACNFVEFTLPVARAGRLVVVAFHIMCPCGATYTFGATGQS